MRLVHGDCLELLATLPDASVDACVTDPPYGIGFMGKEWDTFKPSEVEYQAGRARKNFTEQVTNPNLKGRIGWKAGACVDYDYTSKGLLAFQLWTEQWGREVFRVLKPGAHAVVCGAPRAYHRMACGLEDAGFEIRDCLAWLFGQGFPKSLNLGEGLGTALKPAHEPIVLARKPFKGTVRANVEKHGTGTLNIDATRIESTDDQLSRKYASVQNAGARHNTIYGTDTRDRAGAEPHDLGRWPANVVLDECAAMVLDEQSCDIGGASRFYYVAKPSREERDFGCDGLPIKSAGEMTDRKADSAGLNNPRAGAGRSGGGRNFHPTVKPVKLMRWLVRLVTPINGVVLDPFMGSGTTGMACRYELRDFIGIEREAEYLAIAERRINAVAPIFGTEAGS